MVKLVVLVSFFVLVATMAAPQRGLINESFDDYTRVDEQVNTRAEKPCIRDHHGKCHNGGDRTWTDVQFIGGCPTPGHKRDRYGDCYPIDDIVDFE